MDLLRDHEELVPVACRGHPRQRQDVDSHRRNASSKENQRTAGPGSGSHFVGFSPSGLFDFSAIVPWFASPRGWNSLRCPDSHFISVKGGDELARPASRLFRRGRRLEVLDDVIQFLVELLERIPPTVEVVAEVSYERRRVRRLLEFRLCRAEQL